MASLGNWLTNTRPFFIWLWLMSSSNEPSAFMEEFWYLPMMCPSQWRHNEHDCVSNHRCHDGLLNRLFRHWSKKTSKLRVSGLCAGNSPVTGEFSAQRVSNAENVSIWWRHHDSPMMCQQWRICSAICARVWSCQPIYNTNTSMMDTVFTRLKEILW